VHDKQEGATTEPKESSSLRREEKMTGTTTAGSEQQPQYTLSRVETNQRALIDKILARYATQNAVYRELIQNSNDAGAKNASIHYFTGAPNTTADGSSTPSTTKPKRPLVTKVMYRNDGFPFRGEDWARLSKIAEGNPDPSKVGAFGVGAYTMFSVCEEPMVVSSSQVLMFVWKGDALWTKVGPIPNNLQEQLDHLKDEAFQEAGKKKEWTTFVLDSRDKYPLPTMTSLGKFLASSLTFTKALATIRVYVDEKLVMTLAKHTTIPKEIQVGQQQTTTSWSSMSGWMMRGDSGTNISGTVTTSSNGIFMLGSPSPTSRTLERFKAKSTVTNNDSNNNEGKAIVESLTRLIVTVGDESSSVDARYISALVSTKVPQDMFKKMERVTKKAVPPQLRVEVFLQAGASEVDGRGGGTSSNSVIKKTGTNADAKTAAAITASFAPTTDTGKIYIGFQTSQTTGLAAHVAAPFIPTVEREAIDLVDPTLRIYNSELLQISGMVLRLGLERAMQGISERFEAMHDVYLAEDEALVKEAREKRRGESSTAADKPKLENGEVEDVAESSKPEETKVSKSLMSFAKYMAKGVKSTIVTAVKAIDEIVSNDEEEELTRPLDPRPLSFEEREAILLMRSFCAKPSTPDADIGIAIADGFTRVMPDISPPVLTRTGVVRGNYARLPKDGLEAYVHDNVVRRVVLDNAREYHEYIAQCRLLTMRDFVDFLEDKGIHFDENELYRFLKWWIKYNRIHNASKYGPSIKRHVSFSLENDPDPKALDKIDYFRDRSVFTHDELLMPSSVLAPSFQERIGTRTLEDVSLRNWFSPIPVDVWATYISQQAVMTDGLSSDADSRNLVLTVLCNEFRRQYRYGRQEGSQFSALIRNLLAEKRCIPFETERGAAAKTPNSFTTDFPTELYLPSANLEAFSGISSFRKVSKDLKERGISDDFLLALGVRKSVNIEFLFSNLDKLNWGENPKPLINYLRTATLSAQDRENLRTMAYLPAVNNRERTFAPSELYIGSKELLELNLPIILLLKWPSDEQLSADSPDGKFLLTLGCHVDPPLQPFFKHLSSKDDIISDEMRMKCLKFICKRLQPGGSYERDWKKSASSLRRFNFLPCTRKDPFGDGTLVKDLCSPGECYSDAASQLMGFVVIDAELDRKSGRSLGACFQLAPKPAPQMLVKRLLEIVATAKMILENSGKDEESDKLRSTVLSLFEEVFSYLSSRSNDFNSLHIKSLQKEEFVPVKEKGGKIGWYRPHEVYFSESEDEIISLLFHSVGFSPFLAAVGVKSEASIQDILHRLVAKPQDVLSVVGVEKYTNLLHRIASEPIRNPSKELLSSPFLIAYKQDDSEDGEAEAVARPVLAKAEDICLIDNSFFGRMFPVLSAPHETDLESLYFRFGSRYISKSVNKRFRIIGQQRESTNLTKSFSQRLAERKGLLCSQKNASRPLVSDAARLLDESTLEIIEVERIQAIYSLGVHEKVQQVTCCSRRRSRSAVSIFITEDLDFFDVGSAVGDLILQRCELEDAFLLSNLLEAPLATLRARGFAVDRAVKVKEYKAPVKVKPPLTSASGKGENSTPPVSGDSGNKDANDQKSPQSNNDNSDLESSMLAKLAESSASAAARAGGLLPNTSEAAAAAAQGKNNDSDMESMLAKLAESAAAAASAGGPLPNTSEVAAAAAQGKLPPQQQPNHGDDARNKKRRGLRKLFGGRGNNSSKHSDLASQGSTDTIGTGMLSEPHQQPVPPSQASQQAMDDTTPVSPEADATSHELLKGMLANSLASSKGTASSGINSADKMANTALPEGLGRGDEGCEVIPGQQLKIVGRLASGIKVFSSLKHGEESQEFLKKNVVVVKKFATVLELLCEIYALNVNSVAIYYEQSGNTIAFNSNKALYFNLRLFAHLHYTSEGSPLSSECYSYWFTTMAHELAHNLVSAHNKDHGYYTESYITLFLPKLSAKLNIMGIQ